MATCNTVLQTASWTRPRLRRLRMTRRPVWLRMRTRNPLIRLRLRLVPSSVRLVMVSLVLWVPNGQELTSLPPTLRGPYRLH